MKKRRWTLKGLNKKLNKVGPFSFQMVHIKNIGNLILWYWLPKISPEACLPRIPFQLPKRSTTEFSIAQLISKRQKISVHISHAIEQCIIKWSTDSPVWRYTQHQSINFSSYPLSKNFPRAIVQVKNATCNEAQISRCFSKGNPFTLWMQHLKIALNLESIVFEEWQTILSVSSCLTLVE